MRRMRGSVAAETGIGTSIVFVAMVLVSGTAGSMILDTTNSSSDQALNTFDEALDFTACGLEVRGIVGQANDDLTQMAEIDLTVSLIPGSEPLNLSSLVIEMVAPDGYYFWNLTENNPITIECLSRANVNNNVIVKGDLYLMHIPIPMGADSGEKVTVRLLPSSGFSTTVKVVMPEVIDAKYILLR